MNREQIEQTVGEILALYRSYGNEDYIGEPVSQIEHMCQCAQLAEEGGYDTDMVLAALFHDIGHLCEHIMPVAHMQGFGVADHEKLGADYLREKGFSEKIARLVASHVEAKRYLTYSDPAYCEKLSAASRETLALQGGVMNESEAKAFESDPLHGSYITLRRWDELAKKEHVPLPDLTHFGNLMREHLQNNNQPV
ncbi:phosphonate degradation HD-domain oxygenase [Sediminibacterium soli]|uniref:phosphonate degradation HD-domain oxygenase n=1 Tax=Sediminibacterium soli TaxID=2698829 RepID=UPI001379D0CF|nr:phosphonate degradation HD-domain oxygenase [Sediminibacterium soli]NCI46286.1 HD domain-containing protein [Sediminibacterium soli]